MAKVCPALALTCARRHCAFRTDRAWLRSFTSPACHSNEKCAYGSFAVGDSFGSVPEIHSAKSNDSSIVDHHWPAIYFSLRPDGPGRWLAVMCGAPDCDEHADANAPAFEAGRSVMSRPASGPAALRTATIRRTPPSTNGGHDPQNECQTLRQDPARRRCSIPGPRRSLPDPQSVLRCERRSPRPSRR